MKPKTIADGATYIVLTAGILIVLLPLYLTIITAFKSPEMITKGFFSLPSELYLKNFQQVLLNSSFLTYLANSVMITVLSVSAIILLVPAVSYAIVRNYHSKYFKILYYVFLSGIFVPMQVILVPEIKLANALGMMTNVGIIPIYIAIAFSSNTFLAVGFIRKIPVEIDESAHIDGAGPIRTFIHIIFPVSKTIVATISILATLWIWNDFLLPLIMLNKNNSHWTLTLFQYNMRDQFAVNYTVTAAAFLISIIPVMIAYVFLHNNIVKGLVQGAVKG